MIQQLLNLVVTKIVLCQCPTDQFFCLTILPLYAYDVFVLFLSTFYLKILFSFETTFKRIILSSTTYNITKVIWGTFPLLRIHDLLLSPFPPPSMLGQLISVGSRQHWKKGRCRGKVSQILKECMGKSSSDSWSQVRFSSFCSMDQQAICKENHAIYQMSLKVYMYFHVMQINLSPFSFQYSNTYSSYIST